MNGHRPYGGPDPDKLAVMIITVIITAVLCALFFGEWQ